VLRRLRRVIRCLGLRGALQYLIAIRVLRPLFLRTGRYRLGRLRVRGVEHPVWFRYGSSDLFVFWQVFLKEEYRSVPGGRRILDVGANVGYASVYFLARDPESEVVAVEPDRRNAEILRRNLAPYHARATVVEGAVWSQPMGIKVGSAAAGSEWAIKVRPCETGETPDVEAFDVPGILSHRDWEGVDVMKVDIEGAEVELFRSSPSWITRVRAFAIELHGAACESSFKQALGQHHFTFRLSGSTTLAVRAVPLSA
jgi:FkbM family methyltransferase